MDGWIQEKSTSCYKHTSRGGLSLAISLNLQNVAVADALAAFELIKSIKSADFFTYEYASIFDGNVA